jgi:hypothetical protein
MAPTFDVFLVLHPFRDNVAEFQIMLRPVCDLRRKQLVGADGFYRPRIDTALLVLRFSPGLLDYWGDKIITLFASRCGLPMVVPAELSPRERRRFFLEHLSRYDTYVQQYWDPHEALPLPVRVLEHLREHLDDDPVDAVAFDPRSLPLHGARRTSRLDSVGA